MAEFVISATNRADRGKNAARRLRRRGLVPGIVYGGKGENLAVAVDPKALQRVLRSEAGRNAILKLSIADHGSTNAILKNWQVDPVKESFLHADFYRIAMDVAIRVTVPIHVVGEARGVKVDAGILELVIREIEVECLPADIPTEFRVDVSGLMLNQALRAKDLPMDTAKIKLITDPERVLVHVVTLKVEEEKPVEAVAAEAAAPAEPEVIKKGKKEEEGEEGAEAKPEKTEKKK